MNLERTARSGRFAKIGEGFAATVLLLLVDEPLNL